ncbi:AzlD family protein [Natrinema versiforme]|uniref:Branched-chain amino acid ABC transporter n=1 Tax=Natrinema versiforme JCM 10478 TaxID=1227496 RepID=L9YCE6_9EURY|nr:AzlD domain-containing protein [Natrinema versiforme]ELY71387.1 branched-chain amino acid ABC transporter [Natrinema versiforme JCM 10478]
MSDAFSLEPVVVAVILAMALLTYATKAGGLWLLGRFDVSARVEAGLEILPGVLVVSILAPELLAGGPPEWGGAAVVAVVARRTGNVVLALLAGVGTVLVLRGSF